MNRSCPITLNHGVVGNGRVLALISPTTHIDWLCMPRFDSASVFGRILDVDRQYSGDGKPRAFCIRRAHLDSHTTQGGTERWIHTQCVFVWNECIDAVGFQHRLHEQRASGRR